MSDRMSHEEIQHMSLDQMIQSIKAPLTPLYSEHEVNVVSSLHYSWDGWLSKGAPLPQNVDTAIELCKPLWLEDDFIFENYDLDQGSLKCLFEVDPTISAVTFTKRIKGRLDHAFRQLGTPVKFSRKVGFRSLGSNTRNVVNQYVEKQVGKSDYIDPKFKSFLNDFTVVDRSVDLKEFSSVAHGRYCCNVHLVLVIDDRRYPIEDRDMFVKVRDTCFKIAVKHDHKIARLAIMPDHIHISLRVDPKVPTKELGICFLNNLAYCMGRHRWWSREFYVGSFSEYSVDIL